jgi:hypothetical protein
MTAQVSYRLINSEEQAFIVQTLTLLGLGAILVFVFLVVLFKVLF